MRQFVLATIGTCGDVFPFVAIGKALAADGQRVRLAANEKYRKLALDHGLEFSPLASALQSDELLLNRDLFHPRKGGLIGGRWLARYMKDQYRRLAEIDGLGQSTLIASPMIPAARILHETMRLPLATVCYTPLAFPSCSAPPALMVGPRLPAWAPRPVGRLYWRIFDWLLLRIIGRPLNELRASLGLSPVTRFMPWALSGHLTIATFPDWFAAPQPDWPSNVRMAGFPMFDGQEGNQLDKDVSAFCRSGEGPVVFTFGTGIRNSHELFLAAGNACRELGKRGIILTQQLDELPKPLLPHMRAVEYVPHHALLPHCSAIVHHGGIGTVAKSLAAGIPQLVIPHAWDQWDNALRVEQLGVGTIVRREKVTSERIVQSLNRIMNAETRERCRKTALMFPDRDRMPEVASWIEELAQ